MKRIPVAQDTLSRKIKTWHPCRLGTRIPAADGPEQRVSFSSVLVIYALLIYINVLANDSCIILSQINILLMT